MLGVAFGIGLLLALAGGTAAHRCVAPHHLVSKMLQQLQESVTADEVPNPSVLLAMSLAGDSDSNAHKLLVQMIQQEAVKNAQGMTSGQVALYVLALLSSCQDPRHVHAMGQTVDLVPILQQKTDEEVAKLEVDGVPKTTLFSLSLDALALCLMQAGGYEAASVALAKKLLSPESKILVDTQAMAMQALACTYGHVELHEVQALLWNALSAVTNGFLDEQEKTGGLIGNIYSMGVVLQALEATEKFYAPREWDCEQAFARVYQHDYQQPMAVAQVLPALVGKPYLEAGSLNCTATDGTPPGVEMTQAPQLGTTEVQREPPIVVHYAITNRLQGKPFHYEILVEVPAGSILLKVLEAAEKKDPENFSFKTEETFWGPMVVSIHGLAGNTDDRTYWQFFSGADALQEGVGLYKPHDGEHIEAIFSTY